MLISSGMTEHTARNWPGQKDAPAMLIKVCGMTEQSVIDRAAALGVDLCGFIFYPPSPRNITPERAAALDTHAMLRVGVFVGQGMKETLDIARRARLDFIQLHGGQQEDFPSFFPREKLIRTLFPKNYADAEALQKDAVRLAEGCGMFLVDAGLGSGMTLDWKALAGICFPRPWLLAGGIGPDNAARAAGICRPDGVDLNSRLETSPGRKDPGLLEKTILALRGGEKQAGMQP